MLCGVNQWCLAALLTLLFLFHHDNVLPTLLAQYSLLDYCIIVICFYDLSYNSTIINNDPIQYEGIIRIILYSNNMMQQWPLLLVPLDTIGVSVRIGYIIVKFIGQFTIDNKLYLHCLFSLGLVKIYNFPFNNIALAIS